MHETVWFVHSIHVHCKTNYSGEGKLENLNIRALRSNVVKHKSGHVRFTNNIVYVQLRHVLQHNMKPTCKASRCHFYPRCPPIELHAHKFNIPEIHA